MCTAVSPGRGPSVLPLTVKFIKVVTCTRHRVSRLFELSMSNDTDVRVRCFTPTLQRCADVYEAELNAAGFKSLPPFPVLCFCACPCDRGFEAGGAPGSFCFAPCSVVVSTSPSAKALPFAINRWRPFWHAVCCGIVWHRSVVCSGADSDG